MAFLALFLLCVLASAHAVSDDTYPDLPDDTPENCAVVAEDKPISDTDKQVIVDVHNKLRRSLETEDIKFKTMEWDDMLAGRAQMMANTCQLRHSYFRYYCPGLPSRSWYTNGQNYLRYGYNTANHEIDFAADILGWWQEKLQYNYTTATCDPGRVCGHYLQMAWQKTHKVGCGYKFCEKAYGGYDSATNTFTRELDNQFVFVCNYYPSFLNPDSYQRTSSRPYGPGCMTTPGEEECNNHGTYDFQACECKCEVGFYGKWCEFQEACEDSHGCASWIAVYCNSKDFFGEIARETCPNTCGVC